MCNRLLLNNAADGRGFMEQFRKTLKIFCLPVYICSLPVWTSAGGRYDISKHHLALGWLVQYS